MIFKDKVKQDSSVVLKRPENRNRKPLASASNENSGLETSLSQLTPDLLFKILPQFNPLG